MEATMRATATVIAATILLSATIPPVFAAVGARPIWDGNELLASCEGQPGPVTPRRWAECEGAILGAFADYGAERARFGLDPCVPQTLTDRQLAAVVVRYIHDHPETRALRRLDIVRLASPDEWPACRERS